MIRQVILSILLTVGLTTVVSAQVFYCPNDVDSKFTLTLVNEVDGYTPVTEKKFGDTTITITDVTDGNTPQSYTDDATTWTELGDGTGDYQVTMGAGANEFDEPAHLYNVKIVVTGCRTIRFRVMTPQSVANHYSDIGTMAESTMQAEIGAAMTSQGYTTTRAPYLDNINKTLPEIADFNTAMDTKLPTDFNSCTVDGNDALVATVGFFTDNGLDYFPSSATLVSSIWGAVARTLTAPTNITSDDSEILASSGALTIGTNNDKTGYALSVAGLAAVVADILADPNYPVYTDASGYVGVGTVATDAIDADALAESATTEIGAGVGSGMGETVMPDSPTYGTYEWYWWMAAQSF